MTLHIRTFTPHHVIYVSDRLLSTPSRSIELADDRYKHLVLICDDARVIIGFSGIAGILTDREASGLKHGTLDWITEVLQNTSKRAHGLQQHINDLRDQVQGHIDGLRKKYRLSSDEVKLAIQISGWVGDVQYDCVIDNYLDIYCKAGHARPTFTTRFKTYENEKFEDGSYVFIIGQEYLADTLEDSCKRLTNGARNGNPREIFITSVEVIRTAAKNSTSVGNNCSGVKITFNDPGIQVFNARDESIWETVMPNIIYSTSKLSMSIKNSKGRRTKPRKPFKLNSLKVPNIAQDNLEKICFWFRVIEKLRIKHNEYGAEVRKSRSEKILNRFHQWQEDKHHPVNAAVFEQINILKQKLIEEESDKYLSNDPMNPDSFANIKAKERENTEWDKYINLSDLEEFKI